MIASTEYLNGWNGATPANLDRAVALGEKASRADPGEPWAWHALALANMWQRKFDLAEHAARTSVELNPNFAGGFTVLGNIADFTGRHAEAAACAARALDLDPHYDIAMQLLGRAQFALGRDEDAAASFNRRLARSPRSDMSRAFLAAACGHLGRSDEARRRWTEVMEINPDFSVARVRGVLPYASPAVFDRLADGLRKAGIVA